MQDGKLLPLAIAPSPQGEEFKQIATVNNAGYKVPSKKGVAYIETTPLKSAHQTGTSMPVSINSLVSDYLASVAARMLVVP